MFEIQGLKKTYPNGTHAIKGLDLSIEKGDIYGIIGLSGAGKSTLMRLLTHLETPDEGEILFEGKNIFDYSKKEMKTYRHETGMIFQNFNLLSSRSVKQNVAFSLECIGYPKKLREKRIDEMLELVGLQEKKNVYPSMLSGGQKQRVAIARALAGSPRVLFSDEATSSLDPKTTQSILRLLKNLQKNFGLTIVLITHEMNVIRSLCNKVAILKEGAIVEHGLVSEVFLNPKNVYTKEFLSDFKIVESEEDDNV